MSTSDKSANQPASDPFDQLVFEKKLRIKQVFIDKELDLLAVVLSNGHLIKAHLSDFSRLKNASDTQLKNWRSISGGVGICWDDLDEDISLVGLIKSTALNSALRNLQSNNNDERLIA